MIGDRAGQIAAAVAQPVAASVAMAVVVALVGAHLAGPAPLRLMVEVAVGAITYTGWLALFARPLVRELVAAVRR